jgi:hypothetical protein
LKGRLTGGGLLFDGGLVDKACAAGTRSLLAHSLAMAKRSYFLRMSETAVVLAGHHLMLAAVVLAVA